MKLNWQWSDGGRQVYFKGDAGDCVCRAIANATGRDYMEVYKDLSTYIKTKKKCRSCRDGVDGPTARKYITTALGWHWYPTMHIGSGCTTHLRKGDLPSNTIIVSLSGHYTCVKDGVILDTYDPSRDGTRCVYGFYAEAPTEDELHY